MPCLTPKVRPQGHIINLAKTQHPGSQGQASISPRHNTQGRNDNHHRLPRNTGCSATPMNPICMASGAGPAFRFAAGNRKTTTWAFFIGVRHEKPLPNFKQNLRKAPEVSERFPITFLSFRGPLRSLLYSQLGSLQKTLVLGTSDSRILRYF